MDGPFWIFPEPSSRDRRQILLLVLNEFNQITYSPWNYQKTYGFLMISGGIEVD